VKATVQAFRTKLESDGLAPATINVRLAAIRKLAIEAADNGLVNPALAAGIGRVKGVKRLGVRMGNWLLSSKRALCWARQIRRRSRANATEPCSQCCSVAVSGARKSPGSRSSRFSSATDAG
jgi:hypothetical protein